MNLTIDDKVFEPFIEAELIERRIRVLAIQLNLDYEEKVPIIIGVLNGSFIFMSDLVKELSVSCEMAFVKVSSYHGDLQSSGNIIEEYSLNKEIKGRDIILIEDIVETGNTLNYLIDKFKKENPASISVVSLLYKPKALLKEIPELQYIGFEIENDFVVGYGLDYKGLGRNTKNIYRLCK